MNNTHRGNPSQNIGICFVTYQSHSSYSKALIMGEVNIGGKLVSIRKTVEKYKNQSKIQTKDNHSIDKINALKIFLLGFPPFISEI